MINLSSRNYPEVNKKAESEKLKKSSFVSDSYFVLMRTREDT